MRLLSLCLVLTAAWHTLAATPPAAQLLPNDTLALVSIPDWDDAASYLNQSAYGKLWRDPAMKPFREKFLQQWKDDLAGPLERQLGIQLSDYLSLFHGQVTLALTENGWGTQPGAKPGFLLLADAKDKPDAMANRLSELKKKWHDAGKRFKTEKIRDVEFTTLFLTEGEVSKTLEKAFPRPADEADQDELEDSPASPKSSGKMELTFGQSGSLLIAGSSAEEIEKVLARQAGGLAPCLAEQAVYEANHGPLFRDAMAFGWVNFARVYAVFEKQFKQAAKTRKATNPFEPRTDRFLAATGLGGMESIAARLSGNAEGTSAELFLNVPESRRQGVFKVLALERKEAGPPPFVRADVVKFSRWRIDGQKGWSTLESMLTSISPELSGLLQMGFQFAGKDRDPNFDLKRTLVGNLGDDFISLRKSPRASERGSSDSPSLYLIGSANADLLVQGLKAATALVPLAGGEPTVKEREFLGRKIYSLALPPLPNADDSKPGAQTRQFSFAASGGYAALSADASLLEEYLRSSEGAGRSLRERSGLADAAQVVGGMSTGLFGYENRIETMRLWLESAKKKNAALDRLLSLAPMAAGKDISAEEMTSWLDVSLLPPFERISKYFDFFVYSLSSADRGLSLKFFAPTPPQANEP